jgi:hypothetical protein
MHICERTRWLAIRDQFRPRRGSHLTGWPPPAALVDVPRAARNLDSEVIQLLGWLMSGSIVTEYHQKVTRAAMATDMTASQREVVRQITCEPTPRTDQETM